jgi:nitroreductase
LAENTIGLAKPATTGGMSLADALKNRKSSRQFDGKPIPAELLSNLMWAANGVNREDGHTTAPTAMNKRDIDLYVISAEGVFRFVPAGHRLEKVSGEDITDKTGYGAPLTIALVADMEKAASREIAFVDCGFVSQNIYLFAAANGLATVVKAKGNDLRDYLKLPKKQEVLFLQDVGFPAGK